MQGRTIRASTVHITMPHQSAVSQADTRRMAGKIRLAGFPFFSLEGIAKPPLVGTHEPCVPTSGGKYRVLQQPLIWDRSEGAHVLHNLQSRYKKTAPACLWGAAFYVWDIPLFHEYLGDGLTLTTDYELTGGGVADAGTLEVEELNGSICVAVGNHVVDAGHCFLDVECQIN